MVVISLPSCITASVRQALMRRPVDEPRAGTALAAVATFLWFRRGRVPRAERRAR